MRRRPARIASPGARIASAEAHRAKALACALVQGWSRQRWEILFPILKAALRAAFVAASSAFGMHVESIRVIVGIHTSESGGAWGEGERISSDVAASFYHRSTKERLCKTP